MSSRPSTAAPILAVLAIVAMLLGAYVGGYLWLADSRLGSRVVRPGVSEQTVVRVYAHRWQSAIFIPAARCEALIRWQAVELHNLPDMMPHERER